jgi:ATP-binding cassette, subfamily B, bacterial CvaB/MchF/RaxB
LACITMVLNAFDADVSLRDMRFKYGPIARGLNVSQLVSILSDSGVSSRAVTCEIGELSNLKLPAILHWEFNHYVLLTKVKKSKAVICDPARGVIEVSGSDLEKSFTGVAIETWRTAPFSRTKKATNFRILDLFEINSSMKGAIVTGIILSIAYQLLSLLNPILIQVVIDQVAGTYDQSFLLVLTIGFILLALFLSVMEAVRSLILYRFSMVLGWGVTTRIYKHMLKLPVSWYKRRRLSDTLTRFESLESIRDVVTHTLVAAVLDGVLVGLVLYVMALYSPGTTLVVIALFIVSVLVMILSQRHRLRLASECLRESIIEKGKRIEVFRGIQSIKLNGGSSNFQNEWFNSFSKLLKRQQTEVVFGIWINMAQSVINGVSLVIVVYLLAMGIISNQITLGAMFAFLAFRTQFISRSTSLIDIVIQWRLLRIHGDRLADVVESPTEDEGLLSLDDGLGARIESIALKSVYFRYSPQDALVAENVNVKVGESQVTAISGRSGVGKSTIVQLMTSVLKPTSGSVLINNQPLSSFGLRNYRKCIGSVMQDDDVFSGSISENVSFGDNRPSEEKVWKALEIAQLSEEVRTMPMGLETYIGDSGSNLSGGQRQRLMIARAVYKDPQIVFLDEATANIDEESESKIISSIKDVGIRIVIISHRESVRQLADACIFMDSDGSIRSSHSEKLNVATTEVAL